MVFRIERSTRESGTVELAGRVDEAALAAVRAQCAAEGCSRILLRERTELPPELLPELLALGVVVVAESPYLARWIERTSNGGRP